jgi:hypothetical protein
MTSGGSGDKEKQAQKLSINMAGRWTLSAPNRGHCGMNFTGGEGDGSTIAPEGGCPGSFYTSRSGRSKKAMWSFATTMASNWQSSRPARRAAAQVWFEGQAVAGERVMLARQ